MAKFEVIVSKRVAAWAEIPVVAESAEHAKRLVGEYLAEGDTDIGSVYDPELEVADGEYEGLGSFSWDVEDSGVYDIKVNEIIDNKAECVKT